MNFSLRQLDRPHGPNTRRYQQKAPEFRKDPVPKQPAAFMPNTVVQPTRRSVRLDRKLPNRRTPINRNHPAHGGQVGYRPFLAQSLANPTGSFRLALCCRARLLPPGQLPEAPEVVGAVRSGA